MSERMRELLWEVRRLREDGEMLDRRVVDILERMAEEIAELERRVAERG